MNVILDTTSMLLALVWLVGFFGYGLAATALDVLPIMALCIVVARYVYGKLKDRMQQNRNWIKLTDYDAEH